MASSTRLQQADVQVHEHRTAKVVELVSSSSRSFQEAIENALADARSTTRGITGAHVENMHVVCDDGRITAYKVNLKVSFGVERDSGRGSSGSDSESRSTGSRDSSSSRNGSSRRNGSA
ncbi:MAG TPA: dodecin family protein [Candidatus Thermoplasmatota archaeon]|nr:dodecin family protein [Candidatus Thermoplasmatota archaeon]